MSAGDEAPGLWVRVDLTPLGTYAVTANIGLDHTWPLPRDRALAYAAGCVAAATEAEHDAAVLGLMTGPMDMNLDTAAAFLVHELRPDRPGDPRTLPLRVQSCIGFMTRRPYLELWLGEEKVGEVTPADLRSHAVGVLQTLAAADLDQQLHRALRGAVGLDDHRARSFISTLGEHWPADEAPRGGLQ